MTTRLWLIVLSLISNALALALPLALIQVYDRILANQAVGTALVIFSAVALAILMDGLVKYARASILGRLAAQAEYDLSLKTAEKLLSIDPKKLAEFTPGRIRELFTAINKSNDVLVGQSTLAMFDAPFAVTFLVLVWFLGGPTVYGPLAVLAVFGALAFLSAYWQARAGQRLFEATADQATLIMNRREQIDRIIERGELGDFAGEVRALEKQKAAAQEIAETNLAAALNLGQTGGLATTILVLGLGSLVVLSGDMTTGGLAACLILGQRGVAGLLGLINAIARHQVSASAFKAIQYLLSIPSVSSLRPAMRSKREAIGIRFQLNGVVHEGAPGQCLIIRPADEPQGRALFHELARIVEGGSVENFTDLRSIELFKPDGETISPLHSHVSICDAEPSVFNGTILENMTAFDSDATERAVWLSEQLGLTDAIGRLRDGLETPLSPGLGVPLSDGHLKRLMLVRALSGRPELVLLRNPSLLLDARGIDLLALVLKKLEGETTIVLFESADGFLDCLGGTPRRLSLPLSETVVAA